MVCILVPGLVHLCHMHIRSNNNAPREDFNLYLKRHQLCLGHLLPSRTSLCTGNAASSVFNNSTLRLGWSRASGMSDTAAWIQFRSLWWRAMPLQPGWNNSLRGSWTAAMNVRALASGDLRSSRWTHSHFPPWKAANLVPPGTLGRLTIKMMWILLSRLMKSVSHSSLCLKFSSSSIALCLAHEMRSLLRWPEEHCTRM